MGKRRSSKSRQKHSVDPILADLEYEMKQSSIEEIKAEYARKEAEMKRRYENDLQAATEKAFLMMLHFPLEVLLKDYWPHASKSKVTKFVDSILQLYDDYNANLVDVEAMQQHLIQYGGIQIVDAIGSL